MFRQWRPAYYLILRKVAERSKKGEKKAVDKQLKKASFWPNVGKKRGPGMKIKKIREGSMGA